MMLRTLDLAPRGTGRVRMPSLGVRPADVLRAVMAVLAIGQLGRVPLAAMDAKEAPLMVSDLLVVAAIACGIIAVLRRRRMWVDDTAVLTLAFAAVGGISAALAIPRFGLSVGEFVFSLAYLVRWMVYFALYLVAINFVRREDATALFRAFQTAVVVFAVFGIFQAAFLPGFAQMVHPSSRLYLDWDPQGHRLVSTLLDPNFAGALAVVALLPSLAQLAYGARVEVWRVLTLFVALLLTVSRGAILAFLVGVVVLVAARGLSRNLLRLGAIVAAACIPLGPVMVYYIIAFNKYYIDP